jgi:DNA-binding NtrC family response regulator
VELAQAGSAAELDHALDIPGYDIALMNTNLCDITREDVLHRIAALCPETPMVLQGHYRDVHNATDVGCDDAANNLIMTLRTVMLHAMQIPLRAQA